MSATIHTAADLRADVAAWERDGCPEPTPEREPNRAAVTSARRRALQLHSDKQTKETGPCQE